MLGYENGQIVTAIAGRDKGRHFIVFAVEGEYLLLVDGKHRRVENPKKKKIKHVQMTHQVVQAIADQLNNGLRVTNAEVRNSLKAFEKED